MNESDPCSNVRYLSGSEKKACMGFEPMTSVILVLHRSWAQIPYRPKFKKFFFSDLIFTIAQVVHITVRIIFIHVFICSSNMQLSYILGHLYSVVTISNQNVFFSLFLQGH